MRTWMWTIRGCNVQSPQRLGRVALFLHFYNFRVEFHSKNVVSECIVRKILSLMEMILSEKFGVTERLSDV